MRFNFYFIAGTPGVGRIVIGMKREEAQEWAVAVRYRAHTLRNRKTVNPLVPRSSAGKDGFPSQPGIAI